MIKLAIVCGGILVSILGMTTLLAFGLPPNMAIGLTLFGVCLAGLLGLALRLALVDRARGGDHEH